jgi:hypothetical protein
MEVCEQHEKMFKMISDIHALMFGDDTKLEPEGLRGVVAKHERALRGVNRAVLYLAGIVASVVAAIVIGYIR